MERTHWWPANRWTFDLPPIRELLAEEMKGRLWCDPFAGMHSPAQVTNDLNPKSPAQFHMDALEFLKAQPSDHYDGVLYDPPYSFTQAKECYESFGADLQPEVRPTNMRYWSRCKTEIARIIKHKGKCLCFGWNTMGLGGRRGFEMTRLRIVPHGGSRNDTLCTVEIKDLQRSLFEGSKSAALVRQSRIRHRQTHKKHA